MNESSAEHVYRHNVKPEYRIPRTYGLITTDEGGVFGPHGVDIGGMAILLRLQSL